MSMIDITEVHAIIVVEHSISCTIFFVEELTGKCNQSFSSNKVKFLSILSTISSYHIKVRFYFGKQTKSAAFLSESVRFHDLIARISRTNIQYRSLRHIHRQLCSHPGRLHHTANRHQHSSKHSLIPIAIHHDILPTRMH